MPGIPWLSTDIGNTICTKFPLLCGDIIGSFLSADKDLDNYDRYDIFAEHDPG